MFLSSSLYKAMLWIWMKTMLHSIRYWQLWACSWQFLCCLFFPSRTIIQLKIRSQSQIVCLINSSQNFSVLSRLRFILFLNRFSVLISMNGEYINSPTKLFAAHSRHSFLFYIFALNCWICNGNSYPYLNHNLFQPVQLHLMEVPHSFHQTWFIKVWRGDLIYTKVLQSIKGITLTQKYIAITIWGIFPCFDLLTANVPDSSNAIEVHRVPSPYGV